MILDCTLRDGGHRNNWNFPAEFVSNYLKTIEESGIEFVEIGLRLLKQDKSYGEQAYCREEYIESLNIPEKLQVAVMVKADELMQTDVKAALNRLFINKADSRVDIVRIAVPCQKAPECHEICEILKEKGYKVALNLTKVVSGSENEVLKVVQTIKTWNNFDILYFADTFGQLSANEIQGFVRLIKGEYSGLLGFHGHNDKGLALENSLIAIENGVNCVDSTISGIGKGAGNLPSEVIAAELNTRLGQTFNLQAFENILKLHKN